MLCGIKEKNNSTKTAEMWMPAKRAKPVSEIIFGVVDFFGLACIF